MSAEEKDERVEMPESDQTSNQASETEAVAAPEEGTSSEATEPSKADKPASGPQKHAPQDSNPAKGDASKGKDDDDDDDDDDKDSIDWLTIILMIAVMANIGYWIYVRDTSITGDVEMHRPPGISEEISDIPHGNAQGMQSSDPSYTEEQQDMVRTYIVIANALEIAGYDEVRDVWENDKHALEAAREHKGHDEELKYNRLAYNAALEAMRKSYARAFQGEYESCHDNKAKEEAKRYFDEAVSLTDTKPLEAMARYEDAMLRLRANGAFEQNSRQGGNGGNNPEPPRGDDPDRHHANGGDNPPPPNGGNNPEPPRGDNPDRPYANGGDNPPPPNDRNNPEPPRGDNTDRSQGDRHEPTNR